ncbi:hypothetical protein SSMG_08157 [Streptomyces sp. AA4]|nr:hypothetical protein SSMG_08157 [Streptomyces sp. AA4]
MHGGHRHPAPLRPVRPASALIGELAARGDRVRIPPAELLRQLVYPRRRVHGVPPRCPCRPAPPGPRSAPDPSGSASPGTRRPPASTRAAAAAPGRWRPGQPGSYAGGVSETAEIGARLRQAREARGISQQALADESGISQSFLSRLESGARLLTGRGLLETFAEALGCSVAELTGRPDPVPGALVLSPLSAALSAATWDDVPDVPARPVDELARLAAEANRASADSRYVVASGSLAALLVELHVQAVAGPARDRRAALAALCEACIVTVGIARSLGDYPVALVAGERARAAAARLEDPARAGFASMSTAIVQARIVDRPAALATATTALAALDRADPDADDPVEAEAAGMLHLALAQLNAKARDRDAAFAHLAEAAALAARTGERRTLRYDFGPANTSAWDLSAHAELHLGPQRAEQIVRRRGYLAGLVSLDRRGALEFDLCRCFAQDPDGARDDRALEHLNRAYLAAPERVGNDPLFGPLVDGLERRGRHQNDELLAALKTRVR